VLIGLQHFRVNLLDFTQHITIGGGFLLSVVCAFQRSTDAPSLHIVVMVLAGTGSQIEPKLIRLSAGKTGAKESK